MAWCCTSWCSGSGADARRPTSGWITSSHARRTDPIAAAETSLSSCDDKVLRGDDAGQDLHNLKALAPIASNVRFGVVRLAVVVLLGQCRVITQIRHIQDAVTLARHLLLVGQVARMAIQ